MGGGESDEARVARLGLERNDRMTQGLYNYFSNQTRGTLEGEHTVKYDEQGNAILSQFGQGGKSAYASQLEKVLNLSKDFSAYRQSLSSTENNPYLQKALGATQATYGGMGLLGTSAGAGALAQAGADAGLQMQQMYGNALTMEGNALAAGLQGVANYENQRINVYEALQNRIAQIGAASMGANVNLTNTMVGAQGNLSFGEQYLLGIAGGAGQAATMAAAGCDANLKENIREGRTVAENILNSINAVTFNYKGNDVEYLGIIAQELAKTKYGRSLIIEQDDYKLININMAVVALLGIVAHLNKKLNEVTNANK